MFFNGDIPIYTVVSYLMHMYTIICMHMCIRNMIATLILYSASEGSHHI